MPRLPRPCLRGLVLSTAVLAAICCAVGVAAAAPQPERVPVARAAGAVATASAHSTARTRRVAVRVRRPVIGDRNPFAVLPLYVEPSTPAAAQARAWRDSRPADAALMTEIARQPQALWLGDWTNDVRAAAASRVAVARAAGELPVIVAYDVPDRDCGQHSRGGAETSADYAGWIDELARGVGAGPAALILEPDGLAATDCMTAAGARERTSQLADAVARLAALPNLAVYLDAGNASWVAPAEMARRLKAAGIARARGFAVNVSSFSTTAESTAYGRSVSRRVGNAPFVIDTSRNGAGRAPGDESCNPPGRALGDRPTADTGDRLVDALLWIKRPGESDGACNGGPPAGTWWPDYALQLARAGAAA